MLKDAEQQPKEGKAGASKSKGKQPAQAAEGAEAPPEETPPDPDPTKHFVECFRKVVHKAKRDVASIGS